MYQRQGKAAYKADLNRTLEIDDFFGNPHKNYKTIHIAGTNGKGSVSHSLASILQEAGYKVGLYTSPHLKDFRERIRINGEMITEEWILNFMGEHLNYFKNLEASFFEMTVAMAFEYFKQEEVDIAVIEVGMGGRLDSTNIITPELSIITNIGFDHTAFLGTDIPSIAKEKGGIIKQNIPIVSGTNDTEANNVFKEIATRLGTPYHESYTHFPKRSHTFKANFAEVVLENDSDSKSIITDLTGNYQKENIATVLTALEVLKGNIEVSEQDMYMGLSRVKTNTGLMGRWHKLNDSPKAYCDVAHNEEGLKYVLKQIETLEYRNLTFVLGMVNDKNVEKVLSMFPKNANYIFTQAQIPRALDVETLAKEGEKQGLKGIIVKNIQEAYKKSLEMSSPEDLIFVGGSTFTVAEVL